MTKFLNHTLRVKGFNLLSPENITKRIYSKYQYTHFENDWIYGVWYCGTSFQKSNYYGQFPATFVKRVAAGFPPTELRFLHLCSGRSHIDNAVNVDVSDLPEVDLRADVERLPFGDMQFDVCLIDPPYSTEDATRYGVKRLIRPKKTLDEVHRCLVPGGWLLWLDEKYPSYYRKNWKLHGLIGIITGFERRTRVLSMFRKHGRHEFVEVVRSRQMKLLEESADYVTNTDRDTKGREQWEATHEAGRTPSTGPFE